MPTTHPQIDLDKFEEQREDQAVDLKDQTTHVAITSKAPP
jgi:hypothetical protein